jgi:cytochrome P450
LPLTLSKLPRQKLFRQYQKWAQEYGPIYSIVLGAQTQIVISSDQGVRDLLDKRSAIYSDRGPAYICDNLLMDGNNLLFMRYATRWRTIRKVAHNLLGVHRVKQYIPYQELESEQLVTEIMDQPTEVLECLRRFSFSVMTSMLYGRRTETMQDPHFVKSFKVIEDEMELISAVDAIMFDFFPVLQWLPTWLSPTKRRTRNLKKGYQSTTMDLWHEVKQSMEKGEAKPCFCADLAKVQEEEGISEKLAAVTASALLVAGADTTTNVLHGFIEVMLLFSEVQAKLQAAIDKVVGDCRLPVMEDYARLPYVRCCVKEILRWLPATPLVFPHGVTQDDTYQGYIIPKGSVVIMNAFTIQMDPARHPNPRKFDPDRYASDTLSLAESTTQADVSKRDTFIFGAGRRSCQGIHLAEASLFLAISRLMWAFDITPVKDEKGADVLPDPEDYIEGLVIGPKPFPVDIRPRSSRRVEVLKKAQTEAPA